jgi:hypothetical protein
MVAAFFREIPAYENRFMRLAPRVLPALVLLSVAASACKSSDTCLVVVTLKQVPPTATSVVFDVSKAGATSQRLHYENSAGVPAELTVALSKLSKDLAGSAQITATISGMNCTLATAQGAATLTAGQLTEAALTAVPSTTSCVYADAGTPDGATDAGADAGMDAQVGVDVPPTEEWQSITAFSQDEQPSMLRVAQISANRAYVAWARIHLGKAGVTIQDWTLGDTDVQRKTLDDATLTSPTTAAVPALAMDTGTSKLYAAWADGSDIVVKARAASDNGWTPLGSPADTLDPSPPSCPALALDPAGLAAAWVQGNQKTILLRRWTAASSWQKTLRGPLQGLKDPQATLGCPVLAVSSNGALYAAWVEDSGPGKPQWVDVSAWTGTDWTTITPIEGGASASLQLGGLVVDDRGPIIAYSETQAGVTTTRVKRWDQPQAAWSTVGPDTTFQIASADVGLLEVRPALSLENGKDLQLAWLDGNALAATKMASIRVWRFQNNAWASNKNPIRGSGNPSDLAVSGSFLVFADSAAQRQALLFHYGAVK